ncbi:nucleotide sugar dehydrogenase [Candidatus Pelagibacter ubique]|nr:nucleotide sugar dehydrogenase [Candidatus Pelagibacter ubique]
MKKVTVIGQGFVGFPMSIVLASRLNKFKKNYFNVKGLEIDNKHGRKIVDDINNRILPIKTYDKDLKKNFLKHLSKSYSATCDLDEIQKSDIVVVSISFNFNKKKDLTNLFTLINKISKRIKKGSLILLETTLPPGMCEQKLYPIIKKNLKDRKIKISDIGFAYSYERVTPGKDYFNSIINIPRNFSGIDLKSKKMCRKFLSKVLKNKNLLFELDTIIDCESAKILENSYRATNIALIDEWVKFSNVSKINLTKIIQSIRIRPTHKNIMSQGLGVGGYCLTKDPKFLCYSSDKIFNLKTKFPITDIATKVNQEMPETSIDFMEKNFGSLRRKKMLIIGFTYKEDVGDFRNSPSIECAKKINLKGANVTLYDPFSDDYNNESNFKIVKKCDFKNYDIVLFCVKHKSTKKIIIKNMPKKPYYFDLNNVYSTSEVRNLKNKGYKFFQLGSN